MLVLFDDEIASYITPGDSIVYLHNNSYWHFIDLQSIDPW